MPGVKVSALTVPANSENKPAVSAPDGSFTLQVKHLGMFKLALENTTCYNGITTADISASADGYHDAGAIRLTAKPEPTGANRYTFTPKGSSKFKLTVNNCVREIMNSEFHGDGAIIKQKAADEGITVLSASVFIITEISLPPTLTRIGDSGFSTNGVLSETLIIPRNVETIGKSAFQSLGVFLGTRSVMVNFESGSRLRTIRDAAFSRSRLQDFVLPESLEAIGKQAFKDARFAFSSTVRKLTIPANVSNIGDQAFAGTATSFAGGITDFEILSDALAKPAGAASPFPLGNNLFQNVTGIAKVTLPQAVYDSYTKADLQAIFGSTFTNYRKPDGTAYDFAAKS